ACLCSQDKPYAEPAETAAKALQRAGAKQIYLAGRPADTEASLRAAGVTSFVFAGCDAAAALKDAYRELEAGHD
ncbi:hypothetical protein ACNJUF_21095, partial [Mycobacterium tuberculosis]